MRFEFVRDPPTRVRALAAALELPMSALFRDGDAPLMGWVHAGSVSIRFWWDIHHERPIESADALADKQMHEYSVRFGGGRAECEAALRAAHGEPLRKRRDAVEYDQYGPFFLAAGGGDAFALEWHEREPDWAKPAVDPAARGEDVRRLAAAAAAGTLSEAIAIEFSPPMSAVDCAAALGVEDAVAITTDVHMSSWRIEVRIGGWVVRATLDGWLSGDSVPGAGGIGSRRLGDADTVRGLELSSS